METSTEHYVEINNENGQNINNSNTSNNSNSGNDNNNGSDKFTMNDSVLPVVANSIVELLNSPVPKTYTSIASVMDSSPSTSSTNCQTSVITVRNANNNGAVSGASKVDENVKMSVKFEQQRTPGGCVAAADCSSATKQLSSSIVQTSSSASPQNNVEQPNICAGCNGKIVDRYLLKALDKLWHEDCLKCDACYCRLAEVGKSFFVKCGKIYCRKDYARLFLTKGRCSVCNNSIPAYELVMRASANVYHLECFGCQECNQRFCVGDRFYLDVDNNKILCEYDYNERMYFAQLAQTNFGYNSLAQLKRQISQVDDYDEVQPVPR